MLENINRARGALRGGHTAEGAPSAFLQPKAEEGRLRHRACGKGGMRHMKTARDIYGLQLDAMRALRMRLFIKQRKRKEETL